MAEALTFVKLVARYYEDGAILKAGIHAELLFVRGLAFCCDALTDGFIEDAQLSRLAHGLRNIEQVSRRLVQFGLWERDQGRGGYQIRNWLKYNKSAADIRAARARDAARKRQDRSARNPTGVQGGVRTESSRSPRGIRTPDTDTETETESNRTPSGSVRLDSRAGRARAPQAAPRPAPVMVAARPPDLTAVRAQLAAASAAMHARGVRRPAIRPSQIESEATG